jgi:hypothetical protein
MLRHLSTVFVASSFLLACGSTQTDATSAPSTSERSTATADETPLAQSAPTAAASSSDSAPHDVLAGWVNYTSSGGGYQILLPFQPEVAKQAAQTALGPLDLHVAQAFDVPIGVGVAYGDIAVTPTDPANASAAAAEGALKGMGITFHSKHAIKVFKKYGGSIAEGTDPQLGHVAVVAVFVGKRLYQQTTMGVVDDKAKFAALQDSFKLAAGN